MKPVIYNPLRSLLRLAPAAVATLFLLLPGCSYVMDTIEGAINERASFSIKAEYIGGNTVRITWDEGDYSEGFAGYEIYMTKEQDDEYIDYTIAVAPTSLGFSDLPDNLTLAIDGSLQINTTNTCNHVVTSLTTVNRGVYFYRLGIIHWDKEKLSERIPANGYTGDYATDYPLKTSIDRISGAARVVIP